MSSPVKKKNVERGIGPAGRPQSASLTACRTLCIQDLVPAVWPGSLACPADRRKRDSCLQALASQHCTKLGKQLGPWSRRFPTQTLREDKMESQWHIGVHNVDLKSGVLAGLQRLSTYGGHPPLHPNLKDKEEPAIAGS